MPRSRKGSKKAKAKAKSKSRSVKSKVGIRPIVMKVNYQNNNKSNGSGLRTYSNTPVNRCTEGTYKVKRCCDLLKKPHSNKADTYCREQGFNEKACCGSTQSDNSSNNSLLEFGPRLSEYGPFVGATQPAQTNSNRPVNPRVRNISIHSAPRRRMTSPIKSSNLKARIRQMKQKKPSQKSNNTRSRGSFNRNRSLNNFMAQVAANANLRKTALSAKRASNRSSNASVKSSNFQGRFVNLTHGKLVAKLLKSVRNAHKKLCEECDKVKEQLGPTAVPPKEFEKLCACCNK